MKASSVAPSGVLCSLFLIAACSDGNGAQDDALDQQQGRRSGGDAAVPTQPAGRGALPDFAPLVEQNGTAVVNVEVLQQQRTGGANDPMLDFFRRFGLPPPEGMPNEGQPARGAGSGFIVTRDGYILTNAHVVAEADEVTVRLTDRREFQAKVVGHDTRTDVAVIKIEAQDLPTVRLGDPSRLRPGEWVVAIGSPFGLDNSATAGIVSATSRAVGGDSYVPFIQTDVAVNPGNSGGPLFNMRGEVVGINSMIFSRTGGYMGLSFAIPIDVANNVREQLITSGRVVRGRIGVAVQDVDAQLAQSFGLDRPRGALVSAVEPDGPAAKAGLRPGDVILSVGDKPVERFGEVSGIIASMKPGTETTLRVWRDGKEQTLKVRVEELEQPGEPRGKPTQGDSSSPEARLGISVRALSPEEKSRVETEGNIVIQDVAGAAARAGVQPGDIILGVNGKPVESVQQLRAAVKDAKGTVALLIQRGEAQIFVPIRVG